MQHPRAKVVVYLGTVLLVSAAALAEGVAGGGHVIRPVQEDAALAAARAHVAAQIEAVPVEHFEPHTYTHGDGRVLPYRLFKPAQIVAGERYPLVLFLHGAGGRGDDNVTPLMAGDAYGSRRWATADVQGEHPCFVLVPHCPAESRWVAHEAGGEDQYEPLVGLLEKVVGDLPVDQTRVYVTGLSMGGFASITLLERMPNTFAAAVSVCGGGDPAQASRIAQVPVWLFHGMKDTIVSPEHSREMYAALVEEGAEDTRLYEYEGVGHDSWVRAYTEPRVADWLFAKLTPISQTLPHNLPMKLGNGGDEREGEGL